ncbi:hyalin-like [Patiria miniata]|uniref:HYR domain-containing protein n=1 Tax=Patiria miniata TaxID=46514 RepID=A0A913Z9F8_PATMI|nr:hyalin-like [Patiria miniata]
MFWHNFISVDNVPPVINCPANIIQEVTTGNRNGVEVTWNLPTATDNSGSTPTVILTSDQQLGPGAFFQFGSYTIAYSAVDGASNSAECSFTVTVVDRVPPVITCPADITQRVTIDNRNGIEVEWSPATATDNSGAEPNVLLGSNAQQGPGSFFQFGTYSILYIASDGASNSRTCSFTVTVVDNVPPVINCPANIIQEVTTGNRNGVEVTWNLPTATDNSGSTPTVILTSDQQLGPGAFFQFGSYTIAYSAVDGASNSAECSFTVTVVDRVPPVITCPADITQRGTIDNRNGIEVEWSPATATDNSRAEPNVSLGSNAQQGPGSFFQFGTYIILYIASDGAGNSRTCSFTVTVDTNERS